eukprot:scaffold879_cov410-Prasinococcus_capsulatus_cf.AAC.30
MVWNTRAQQATTKRISPTRAATSCGAARGGLRWSCSPCRLEPAGVAAGWASPLAFLSSLACTPGRGTVPLWESPRTWRTGAGEGPQRPPAKISPRTPPNGCASTVVHGLRASTPLPHPARPITRPSTTCNNRHHGSLARGRSVPALRGVHRRSTTPLARVEAPASGEACRAARRAPMKQAKAPRGP